MSQTPPAGGQMGYEPPSWYTQMQQSSPAMPAPAAPQMPYAQQFQFPTDGGAPQQMPGLMANPSVFQFVQGLMDQPGAQPGGLPGYGTPYAGGAPAFMQQNGDLRAGRNIPPPVAPPISGSGSQVAGRKRFGDTNNPNGR